MTAHYPAMPDETFNDDNGMCPPVQIYTDHIVIGGTRIDGMWIEENGVTVHPGLGTDINRVTVTFLVGKIDVDDASLKHVKVKDYRPTSDMASVMAIADGIVAAGLPKQQHPGRTA